MLGGCAGAPKDAGFGDVRQLVSDRTGAIVHWDGHTADDQAVALSIAKMLSGQLTADQAVQIALLNNDHIQASFEDLGIAQADLVQAGLLKNPVFDLGVRFPDRGPSGTYLDFAVAEDFLDVALLPARTKLAAAQFEMAKAQVSQEVLTFAAQTRADFYDCQAAAQMLEFRRAMAQAAAASLEAAKKLHDAGNLNDLDFADERAQEVRARIDAVDAEALATEAREKVTDDMGLTSAQARWTPAPLPEIPPREIADRGLELLALSQRQDFAAARQNYFVQIRVLKLTGDTRFVDEANLGAEFERETDGQWRIGPSLSVPIPIFDQGQARMSRAEAMAIQSLDRVFALATDIRSQVRTARAKLSNARTRALLYRDQVVPIARDVLRQTELQYNGMYVGVFRLLEAKRQQIDAANQYIEALRDYWTARGELEEAVGGRLPADAASTQPDTQGGPS
jgi:cobalt-zinc-cadmium efflux system outer membrane protein